MLPALVLAPAAVGIVGTGAYRLYQLAFDMAIPNPMSLAAPPPPAPQTAEEMMSWTPEQADAAWVRLRREERERIRTALINAEIRGDVVDASAYRKQVTDIYDGVKDTVSSGLESAKKAAKDALDDLVDWDAVKTAAAIAAVVLVLVVVAKR